MLYSKLYKGLGIPKNFSKRKLNKFEITIKYMGKNKIKN